MVVALAGVWLTEGTGEGRVLRVLAVGGFAQVLVASLAYFGPVLRGGGHERLSAGFATTASWPGLVLANVTAVALLADAGPIAVVAAAAWAADTGWRAVGLLADDGAVEHSRSTEPDVDRLDVRTLLPLAGDGVHWTLDRDGDLNVNLVHLDAGHEVGAHVNDAVDVLLVGIDGTGDVVVDGRHHDLAPCVALHVPKGARRLIRAGGLGFAYLTVHVRRRGPTIGPRRDPGGATTTPESP